MSGASHDEGNVVIETAMTKTEIMEVEGVFKQFAQSSMDPVVVESDIETAMVKAICVRLPRHDPEEASILMRPFVVSALSDPALKIDGDGVFNLNKFLQVYCAVVNLALPHVEELDLGSRGGQEGTLSPFPTRKTPKPYGLGAWAASPDQEDVQSGGEDAKPRVRKEQHFKPSFPVRGYDRGSSGSSKPLYSRAQNRLIPHTKLSVRYSVHVKKYDPRVGGSPANPNRPAPPASLRPPGVGVSPLTARSVGDSPASSSVRLGPLSEQSKVLPALAGDDASSPAAEALVSPPEASVPSLETEDRAVKIELPDVKSDSSLSENHSLEDESRGMYTEPSQSGLLSPLPLASGMNRSSHISSFGLSSDPMNNSSRMVSEIGVEMEDSEDYSRDIEPQEANIIPSKVAVQVDTGVGEKLKEPGNLPSKTPEGGSLFLNIPGWDENVLFMQSLQTERSKRTSGLVPRRHERPLTMSFRRKALAQTERGRPRPVTTGSDAPTRARLSGVSSTEPTHGRRYTTRNGQFKPTAAVKVASPPSRESGAHRRGNSRGFMPVRQCDIAEGPSILTDSRTSLLPRTNQNTRLGATQIRVIEREINGHIHDREMTMRMLEAFVRNLDGLNLVRPGEPPSMHVMRLLSTYAKRLGDILAEIRESSLAIAQSVGIWKKMKGGMPSAHAFHYQGINYFNNMRTDLVFLNQSPACVYIMGEEVVVGDPFILKTPRNLADLTSLKIVPADLPRIQVAFEVFMSDDNSRRIGRGMMAIANSYSPFHPCGVSRDNPNQCPPKAKPLDLQPIYRLDESTPL